MRASLRSIRAKLARTYFPPLQLVTPASEAGTKTTLRFELADTAAAKRKEREAEQRVYAALRDAHRAFQQDGVAGLLALHDTAAAYDQFVSALCTMHRS